MNLSKLSRNSLRQDDPKKVCKKVVVTLLLDAMSIADISK